ncbi:MAG: hypothetical protein MPL62_15255, partial [Alphaproteobacteria bacterium]|nr:hypothetical protein [Alphaproteobacteria bacterium]
MKSDEIWSLHRDDTLSSDNHTHAELLTKNLSELGFAAIPVAGDGNCFFHSINEAISQAVESDSNFHTLLSSKGYDIMSPPEYKVQVLWHLPVEEWLGKRTIYENYSVRKGWFSNTSFTTGLKTLP